MSSKNPEQQISAYVPVIHNGYLDFFLDYPDATINIFGQEILADFDYLRKDIRALAPEDAADILQVSLGRRVQLLSKRALTAAFTDESISHILADDDLSRTLARQHGIENTATFEPVFLRWDRDNAAVNQDIQADRRVAAAEVPEQFLRILGNEVESSTDWWRHVGAVISKEGELIGSAHNQALPTDYSHYIDGDPRITAKRGENIDRSLHVHAESKAIAEAARDGVSLRGAEILVSTFPCPNCAKLIAVSGIERCYFVEGYAMLDGHSVLKAADVEIVKIDGVEFEDGRSSATPYPAK
jgi:dCMP deaminase